MSRRGLTLGLAVFVTAALVALAFLLPVPYVVLVPGPLTDTLGNVSSGQPVISVSGARTYNSSGRLYLTTVGVVPGDCSSRPTLVQALSAWWDKTEAVEPHQVICPPGQSSSDVATQNEQDMAQSQLNAIAAGLKFLGYHSTGRHVAVLSVEPDAPAAKVLSAGDVILAVDGTPVAGQSQLRKLISAHRPGDTLSLKIHGCTGDRTVQVQTISSQGRTIVGVGIGTQEMFPLSVCIGVDPTSVGGPSAGLAFTLGIIDKLTPGGIIDGRTVAATGTIDINGKVGPIGGIQQKIAAAVRAHASVFLAPAGDCADAKSVAPSSLTLVRVDKLATAVAALKSIERGGGSFPRC